MYSTLEWPVDEQRIYYVLAPDEYYGNRLYSYDSYLTFSLRSRVGIEVQLTDTEPVIIEGHGELSTFTFNIEGHFGRKVEYCKSQN